MRLVFNPIQAKFDQVEDSLIQNSLQESKLYFDGSENVLRLNLATTTIPPFTGTDILKVDSANGWIWNDGGEDIDVRWESSGDSKILFKDGGNDTIAFGTTNTSFTANGVSVIPKAQVFNGNGNSNIDFIIRAASDTANSGAFLTWFRSRGTDDSPTVVVNGDRIGVFRADAYDGTEYITAGSQSFAVEGTPSTGIVGGAWSLSLNDGAGGGNTTKVRVRGSDGFVGIGTSAMNAMLDVRGSAFFNYAQGDNDFRIYGINGLAFWFDASASRFRIGDSVNGELLELWTTKTEWNRTNLDIDFIVNTQNLDHTLWIDGGADEVGFGTSAPDGFVHVDGHEDEVQFIVEGHSTQTSDILAVRDSAGSDYVQITGDGYTVFSSRVQGNKGSDVASSSQITLGDGNYFDVTGTTTIDYITSTGWQAGSIVSLQFDSSVTVKHATSPIDGTTAPFRLSGSVDFSATAGDTLTLIYDAGNVWRELARTVI